MQNYDQIINLEIAIHCKHS